MGGRTHDLAIYRVLRQDSCRDVAIKFKSMLACICITHRGLRQFPINFQIPGERKRIETNPMNVLFSDMLYFTDVCKA